MSIRITKVTVTPVAFADPPLLNAVGVHEPFALRAIIDEHGPDAIAFYISGQLLTEDYYAINKLAGGMKGGAYKGCICGGISMGVLGRDQIDIKLDFDDVRFRGG